MHMRHVEMLAIAVGTVLVLEWLRQSGFDYQSLVAPLAIRRSA